MKKRFFSVLFFLTSINPVFLEASTKNTLRKEKFEISNLLLNPVSCSDFPIKAVVRHFQKEDGTVDVIMEILPSTQNHNFEKNKKLLTSRKLGFKTNLSTHSDIVILDLQDFQRSTIQRKNKQKISETKKTNPNYLAEKMNVTLGEDTLFSYTPCTKVSAYLEFKAPFSPLQAFQLIISTYK